MKRKMLYVSMCAPFPDARHAGGKTFDYYIEAFAKDPNNEVTLISKILRDEEGQESKINKRINAHLIYKPTGIKLFWYYFSSLNSKLNPCYRYGNVLLKASLVQYRQVMKKLKQSGYKPDVVILEWTTMLLFIDVVKQFFPDAVYIASEHDVSFLGASRKYLSEKNPVKRIYKKFQYITLKTNEISCIRKCDLVVTHNKKDYDLLRKENIPAHLLGTIVPYFDAFHLVRNPQRKDILFYGAMNRTENSESALWFIENVMPLLKDCAIRFVILGNKPPQELVKLSCDKIVVTGFVENVTPYFESSLCAAVPLLHGAGVKVKVLEALSAGIPVLTNEIGIEGIPAENEKEFFFCQTAEQYAKRIIEMLDDYSSFEQVSRNAQQMIAKHYNIEESFKTYSEHIYALIQKNKSKCSN